MRDSNQHNIHNQDAGYRQTNCRNTRDTHRQNTEYPVKRVEHRVLSYEGNILFTVVSFFHGGCGKFNYPVDCFAAFTLYDDSEDIVCIKETHRGSDRDINRLLKPGAKLVACVGQHTDHSKAMVADAQPFPYGRFCTEQFRRYRFSDDANRTAFGPVLVIEKLPRRDVPLTD